MADPITPITTLPTEDEAVFRRDAIRVSRETSDRIAALEQTVANLLKRITN